MPTTIATLEIPLPIKNLLLIKTPDYTEYIEIALQELKKFDPVHFEHSIRLAEKIYLNAEELKLTEHERDLLVLSALMHDIGILIVNIEILNKKNTLTEKEWQIIKKHSRAGFDYIKNHFPETGKLISEIIVSVHEHQIDNPYPRKKNRKNNPLVERLSRILAIYDAFDALLNKRPYKNAFSIRESLEIIKKKFSPINEADEEIISLFERQYA